MNGTRPGRFAALCVIAGITSIAAANWLVDTFGSNVIVVGICAAILAIALVIAIPTVDDVRTARDRSENLPLPAQGTRSGPIAGGPRLPGSARHVDPRRPRSEGRRPPTSRSRWL